MISPDDFLSIIKTEGGLAKANLFKVILPTDIPGTNLSSADLNLLCKNVQLPGRQILTSERTIGPKVEKIAYGFAVEDLSLTFHVTNSYSIKQYFDSWSNLVFSQNSYEVNYKNNYTRDIEIHQLSGSTTGQFISNGVSTFKNKEVIYKIVLENAYPTTVNAIELNNEQNNLVELSVQLSYDNWRSK